MFRPIAAVLILLSQVVPLCAENPPLVRLWPGHAPDETTSDPGQTMPTRANENPPATRITKITQPQLEVYLASSDDRSPKPAVLIFPGGGFNYVVRDKEGEEPARWLNRLGLHAIVVRYRTKDGSTKHVSDRPLQDGQRAIRLVRSKAEEWKVDPNRIGVMGFSAGGNVAALLATRTDDAYAKTDAVDSISLQPNFAMLIYAAYLWDAKTESLSTETPVSEKTPPTLIIHTHDDGITSLGPIAFYAALKRKSIPAEIHVFRSGGHGYGMRSEAGSSIHAWPDIAARWIQSELLKESK